jgi:hypothetical protein
MPAFTEWESFYVIVGSSGAALTGLQFVVIALTVDVKRRSTPREIDAFATPTIVHFCAVLLVSAVLSAPWRSPDLPAVLLGLSGALGVVYSLLVAGRTRRQTGYTPVLEDWIFHVWLPLLAYGMIGVAAFNLWNHMEAALFVIAAASLLLLFIGIHNAWDTVTFLAVGDSQSRTSGAVLPSADPAERKK